LDSAKILSAAGRYVQRHGLLSHQAVANLLRTPPQIPNAEPPNQGELASQIQNETYVPVRLSLGTEGPLGHPELWSALNVKQRPSVTLTATVSLIDQTGMPLDAPLVKDRTIQLREIKPGNAPAAIEILKDLGVPVQIQGRAIDAAEAPLAGARISAWVLGKSVVSSATSDAEGKFGLELVLSQGEHDIELRGTANRPRQNEPPERFHGESSRTQTIPAIFDENTGIPKLVVVEWELKFVPVRPSS
jgi:hypothetical protein